MVVIEMNDGGIIKIELDYQAAPITCANFEKLVENHFYDGIIVHRVIKDFMIQGGDPTKTGMGGSEEKIKGEFSSNVGNNPLHHYRATISMARSQNPNSASSQFFIVHKDSLYLDGNYAAFGKVVEGMDVVDAIASVKTDRYDIPLTEQVIKKAYII